MLGIVGSIILFLIAVWIVIAIGYIALPVIGVLVLLYFLNGSPTDHKKGTQPAAAPAPAAAAVTPARVAGYSQWESDWGSNIRAIAQTTPCAVTAYQAEGYQYRLMVDIPLSRLAKAEDAWRIEGDRAQTLQGCWYKRTDGLVQARMLRKKDNKLIEKTLNFDDGTWSVTSVRN